MESLPGVAVVVFNLYFCFSQSKLFFIIGLWGLKAESGLVKMFTAGHCDAADRAIAKNAIANNKVFLISWVFFDYSFRTPINLNCSLGPAGVYGTGGFETGIEE